jgi:hypothetical protein
MPDTIPSKAEIFKITQAQSESVQQISERLVKIENLADKQESRNKNIIIAVLFAFIAIVVTVAVQVSVSEKRDWAQAKDFLEKVQQAKVDNIELQGQLDLLKSQNATLQNNIDSMKTRNPYLK